MKTAAHILIYSKHPARLDRVLLQSQVRQHNTVHSLRLTGISGHFGLLFLHTHEKTQQAL